MSSVSAPSGRRAPARAPGIVQSAMHILIAASCMREHVAGAPRNADDNLFRDLPFGRRSLSLLGERLANESPPMDVVHWLGAVAILVLSMTIHDGLLDAGDANRMRWACYIVERWVNGRSDFCYSIEFRLQLQGGPDSVRISESAALTNLRLTPTPAFAESTPSGRPPLPLPLQSLEVV